MKGRFVRVRNWGALGVFVALTGCSSGERAVDPLSKLPSQLASN